MVGPALPRVTIESSTNDGQRFEKPRWQPQPWGTHQHNFQSRPHQAKFYAGADSGKRSGQRSTNGADCRVGGSLDAIGRINAPSMVCSSGQSSPQSNLDRFLEETTPRVKTQTLPKSRLPSSMRRCNPDVPPYFNLRDLWDSFDEWSAYGCGVHLMLNGDDSAVQYYVPYLSALQLYVPSRRPDWHPGSRRPGSESDTCSEASSDGESEILPPKVGNGSRLELSYTFVNGEKVDVWSYFEKSPPYSRVPLVDKIADLSRDFKAEKDPLRTLRSVDLLPKSWLSVAWYPIYRIPTGPTLRDLAACFLTFHPLSTPFQDGDVSLRQGGLGYDCVNLTRCPLNAKPLRAFGLASYKLRGAIWSSNPENRLASTLQLSADEHLKDLCVEHPDFNYFTSHTAPTRH